MEVLKELVNIVNKQAVKKLDIPGRHGKPETKINQLYEGIHSGAFETDADASNALYDTEPDNPTYKKLKYRLQQKLVKSFLLLDPKSFISAPNFAATNKCRADTTAAINLYYSNARQASYLLAKKTLNTAIKLEVTDLALSLCRLLRYYYNTVVSSPGKSKKYLELSYYYYELQGIEMKAETYYHKLFRISTQSGKKRIEAEEIASKYVKELNEYCSKYRSSRLHTYAYTVHIYRYHLVNDYHNVLKVSKEASAYFETHYKNQKQKIINFLIYQLLCYIQLKDYKKGEKVAQRCLSYYSPGDINWFSALQYYIILCFHTRQYLKAYELIVQGKQQAKFKTLNIFGKENWRLFEAYANFLVKIGKIDVQRSSEKLKPFRISKFLNEVPLYSTEKSRANIPILIIQLLFFLQQHQYAEVAGKVQTLNIYCYRYLRKDDTFRSNCFIKMLLMLPKANFNRTAVIRKTKPLLDKLHSVPLESARQSGEIEIIPYERLWHYILEMLDHKFHYH